MLRYDLAITNDDANEAGEQLRAVVKLREAHLQRLLKLQASGAVPAITVDTARRQVANAKYILARAEDDQDEAVAQLKVIVAICAAELKRIENVAKSGSSSPAEVGIVRSRLAFANYLLHHETEEPNKAIEHLRIVIAERELAANRMDKLYRAGAAGRIVFVQAQHNYLWAKVNLAIEEEQRIATRDILKKLVESAKEQHAYLQTHPDVGTPEMIASYKAAVSDFELRLALASDPDTSLRTLLRKPFRELDN